MISCLNSCPFWMPCILESEHIRVLSQDSGQKQLFKCSGKGLTFSWGQMKADFYYMDCVGLNHMLERQEAESTTTECQEQAQETGFPDLYWET